MPSKQNDHDLAPLLEAQQLHLSVAMTDSASIDAKALGIAAANIAVLIFIAQVALDFPGWWAHAGLLVPYLLSLVCNVVAVIPRRYIGPGVDIEHAPEYLDMDHDTLVIQLLVNTQAAIRINDRLNKQRWKFCAASLLLTALGTGVLFAIL